VCVFLCVRVCVCVCVYVCVVQGDIVELFNQEHDEWWEGQVRDKQRGYFPKRVVRVLTEEEVRTVF